MSAAIADQESGLPLCDASWDSEEPESTEGLPEPHCGAGRAGGSRWPAGAAGCARAVAGLGAAACLLSLAACAAPVLRWGQARGGWGPEPAVEEERRVVALHGLLGLDEAPATGSLYCWSCMRTSGYELGLMALHRSRGMSIFACEGNVLFTTTGGQFNGMDTIAIGDDPTHMCQWGSVQYACNTKIFVKAWEKLVEMGHYRQYAWTVKVDPDAGFFPARLKQRIAQVGDGQMVFIQNANFPKMLGPIEVVTRAAVDRFASLRQDCYDRLDEDVTGEDGYFSDCFSQVLGVPAHEDYGLLANGDSPWLCSSEAACVHPLKDEWRLQECYDRGR